MHRRMAGSLYLHLCYTDGCHPCTGDTARGRLAHDHVSRLDEAARQQEHVVVPPSGPVNSKLLPVELVAHGQIAASTALKVPLLKARVARDDLSVAVLSRREQKAVVIHGRLMRVLAIGGGGWRGKRHDVCLVVRILPCWQRWQWCCCGEKQVVA